MQKRYGLDCINYLTDVATPSHELLGRTVRMSAETKRLSLQREIESRRSELDLLVKRLGELEGETPKSNSNGSPARGRLATLLGWFD